MAKLMNFEQLRENFKTFCTENGYEVDETAFELYFESKNYDKTHKEALWEIISGTNPKVEDFGIRKIHPTRDKIIKKGAMPIGTSVGVGAIVGSSALAASVASGSTFFGTTMLGNPTMDFLNVGLSAFLIGTVGCYGFIKAKQYATIKYYKAKYGSADKNLQDAKTIDLENLKIAQLMQKVENTKEKILGLREGKWFTAPFRFTKRHILNSINRNRLHHIESVTIDLFNQFNAIINAEDIENDLKLTSTQKLYDILSYIKTFIGNDIETSKVYALTNCRETENHSHKIENLDIYANLEIMLKAYEEKASIKTAKKTYKSNIAQKKATANTIFNHAENSLLQKALDRRLTLSAASAEPTIELIVPIEESATPIITPEVVEVVAEEVAPVVAEEVAEIASEELPPVVTDIATPAAPARESLISKMVKVNLQNLVSGKKVIITHPDRTQAVIKITHTPAGRKIKIETKNIEGVKATSSLNVDSSSDLSEQINSTLQETALRFGANLEELKLL